MFKNLQLLKSDYRQSVVPEEDRNNHTQTHTIRIHQK